MESLHNLIHVHFARFHEAGEQFDVGPEMFTRNIAVDKVVRISLPSECILNRTPDCCYRVTRTDGINFFCSCVVACKSSF